MFSPDVIDKKGIAERGVGPGLRGQKATSVSVSGGTGVLNGRVKLGGRSSTVTATAAAFPGRGQSGEARDPRTRRGPGLVTWT